ncbi:MAG: aminotransferase class V-fold PLP-dependent enzyme [Balneolaceae bacterium]
MQDFDHLAHTLQPHYSHFNVANRLLFTGHSHQAWPDVAFAGIQEYMRTVAKMVDTKWEAGFEKTEILRNYLRDFYDDPEGLYCREQNTHVMLVSWLSSFDLKNKPKVITTTGEFHSLSRQLNRLEEEGLQIKRIPHQDDQSLLDEITKELDDQTSAVMISRVYFETSEINTKLKEIAAECRKKSIPLLIDDYHGTNVVPLSIREEGLDDCYILIGGYKYLQWGESNCFLRFPKDCDLRPAITGWFAAFNTLDKPQSDGPVPFDDGDQRFATATYDPISQFRAAEVVNFFRTQGLTPDVLRKQYSSQVQYLIELFEDQNFEGSTIERSQNRPIQETGGFLSLRSPNARVLRTNLLEKGIFSDARDQILRFGPAPYTTSKQCEEVIEALFTEVKNL